MWGKPLDTCMLDVRFREKFEDALAVVISDEERAGLDILTHGDFHCDEDFAGRSWHHYPLQRWAGFEGDQLQSEADPQPVAALSARHAAQRDLHRVALAARDRQDRAPAARLSEDLAHRPEQVAQAGAVRHLLLAGDGPVPRHPHRQVQGQPRGGLGHGGGDEHGAARAPRRRLPLHPDRRADPPLHGQHLRRQGREGEVHGRLLQPRGAGPGRRGDLDSHLLGQPQHAAGDGGHQLQGVVRAVSERDARRRLDDRDQGPQLHRHRAVRPVQRASCRRSCASARSATARCRPIAPRTSPRRSGPPCSTSRRSS